MSTRVVYGNTHSLNGWPMVDQGSCRWVKVPGTNVTLQIREGQPEKILAAFAADFNAYVEPLRDADSACWTATNSVPTSNHLSGTAADLNWNGADGKTFRLGIPEERAYPPPKNQKLRELLGWYEGMVFCGGDWSIRDFMHFEMGGNTYGSQHVEKVNDFIHRKIRPDGFSTFRRSAAPPKPSVMTVPLTPTGNGRWTSPNPAWAHLINRESGGDPTIIQQIIDVNSGGNEAEGLFQITPRTWRAHNGTEFAASARLASPQQQAIVAARIITRNPSGSDWGAGLPGRENASELLAGLVPVTDSEEDDLTPEQDKMLREVHAALFNRVVSESRYRHLGEGPRWQLHEMIRHVNAFAHEEFVEREAKQGDPEAIALVYEIAHADPQQHPDRQQDAQAARRFLDSLTAAAPTVPQPGAAAPTIVNNYVEPQTVNAELVPTPEGDVSQTVSAIAQQLLERAAQQVTRSLGL